VELQSYYFPLLFLEPEVSFISATQSPFRLTRRRWTTSTFDLATLATKHRLHLAYQLMDVLLGHCHLELQVDAVDREQAIESLSAILLGLYMHGVSPTLAPFVTTHSINEYSGINSRDSEGLRAKLPPELQEGLTSTTATIEAWPVNPSLAKTSCFKNYWLLPSQIRRILLISLGLSLFWNKDVAIVTNLRGYHERTLHPY
jgi:hypothetical protein